MGDIATSRGSEIILRWAELDIFRKLKKKKKIFDIYLIFKDIKDIFVIVNGSNEDMKESLKIIATGWLHKLNSEVNIIHGKFLNLRIYNVKTDSKLLTTILRKQNCQINMFVEWKKSHPQKSWNLYRYCWIR